MFLNTYAYTAAKEKGEHATTMVDTAKRLLTSAKAMSEEAEAKEAKERAAHKSVKDESLLW